MTTIYNVDFSSGNNEYLPGKNPISLDEKTTNSNTSLTLTGRGLQNYGEIQQENYIKLLENFASASAPLNPTIGQLWFDTGSRLSSGANIGKPNIKLGKLKICTFVTENPAGGTLNPVWETIYSNETKPVSFYNQDSEPLNHTNFNVDFVISEVVIKVGDIWFAPTDNVFRICTALANDGSGIWKILANWKAGATLPTIENIGGSDVDDSPEIGQVFLQTLSKPILWVRDNVNHNNGWTKVFTEFKLPFFYGSEAELKTANLTIAPGFLWLDTTIQEVKICKFNNDSLYRFNNSTQISDIGWHLVSKHVYIQTTQPDSNVSTDGTIWLETDQNTNNTPIGIIRIFLNGSWHELGKPSNLNPLTSVKQETGVPGSGDDYSREDHQHPATKVELLLNYSGSLTPDNKDILRYDGNTSTWYNNSSTNFYGDVKQWLKTNYSLQDLSNLSAFVPDDTYLSNGGTYILKSNYTNNQVVWGYAGIENFSKQYIALRNLRDVDNVYDSTPVGSVLALETYLSWSFNGGKKWTPKQLKITDMFDFNFTRPLRHGDMLRYYNFYDEDTNTFTKYFEAVSENDLRETQLVIMNAGELQNNLPFVGRRYFKAGYWNVVFEHNMYFEIEPNEDSTLFRIFEIREEGLNTPYTSQRAYNSIPETHEVKMRIAKDPNDFGRHVSYVGKLSTYIHFDTSGYYDIYISPLNAKGAIAETAAITGINTPLGNGLRQTIPQDATAHFVYFDSIPPLNYYTPPTLAFTVSGIPSNGNTPTYGYTSPDQYAGNGYDTYIILNILTNGQWNVVGKTFRRSNNSYITGSTVATGTWASGTVNSSHIEISINNEQWYIFNSNIEKYTNEHGREENIYGAMTTYDEVYNGSNAEHPGGFTNLYLNIRFRNKYTKTILSNTNISIGANTKDIRHYIYVPDSPGER